MEPSLAQPRRLPIKSSSSSLPFSSITTLSSSSAAPSLPRSRPAKPSQITVTPYSSFHADADRKKSPPVRRKAVPLSASASPVLPSFSTGGVVVAVADDARPPPVAARLPPSAVQRPPWLAQSSASPNLVPRDLDQFPRGLSPNVPGSPAHTSFADLPAHQARQVLQDLDRGIHSSPPPVAKDYHARKISEPLQHAPPLRLQDRLANGIKRSVTMPVRGGGPTAVPLAVSSEARPASPKQSKLLASNKITSFFGWKASSTSPIAETSPTTPSERSSPAHSPSPFEASHSSKPSSISIKSTPRAIDVSKANAHAMQAYSNGYPQAPPTPAMSIKMEELEEELREITAELAGSIRREMELEDQVERLQLEGPSALDANRRTSDYFSDSGTSSVAGGSKSAEQSKERRKSEQDRAQSKLDISSKLQDERARRKAMEAHVKTLEEHIQNIESRQATIGGASRIHELETALEDNKRKLQEERHVKENYEDLLNALRGDLELHKNERDNLRDEVVPQLRARVEGLEAESAEFQKLTYENARMQQELRKLKQSRVSIGSIAEEGDAVASLKRSTSVATRSTPGTGLVGRSGSISRSNSISKDPRESRESLADRVKEIELQRDALHRALKSLLDRQRYQTREHEKRVRNLEGERDHALESHSPRRRGYEAEVRDLRHEINELRRRADDALEQKWQCEKGLGGLKKDLDRAEQETSSLRAMLRKKDVLGPDTPGSDDNTAAATTAAPPGTSAGLTAETHATSASLERAYEELRDAQARSVSRLRELKGLAATSSADDAITEEHLDMLLKTMSEAEAERDLALKQAHAYRAQAASLQESSTFVEGERSSLAEQLQASARRVDGLAAQVRYQLEANAGLRARLADAVGKGEREQAQSAQRINNMQDRLKSLEERLVQAQQHSEDAVVQHEEDLRRIRESHNGQLQRLTTTNTAAGLGLGLGFGHRSPTSGSQAFGGARTPRSPMFGARSPQLQRTSTGVGRSMNEALRTEFLERRVHELEAALGEADREMHEVVQRMNAAQIEVMELQSARDEAAKSTRTLQNQIQAENEKVGSLLRFLPL